MQGCNIYNLSCISYDRVAVGETLYVQAIFYFIFLQNIYDFSEQEEVPGGKYIIWISVMAAPYICFNKVKTVPCKIHISHVCDQFTILSKGKEV